MSRGKVQKCVNATITHRHPQLLPIGEPAGELTVSIETVWRSLQ